jgi:lysophospholipase L1-like esterase
LTAFFWLPYSQINNTLSNNGKWDSSKIHLEKYLIGAQEYYNQRPTLAHDELNLGAWLGYQEVITKNPVNFQTIEFDFSTKGHPSYFYFVFNKTEYSEYALRLSTDPNIQQGLFLLSTTGEFVSQEILALSPITENSWHHVLLKFDSENHVIHVIVDDKPATTIKADFFASGKFGFRGSNIPVFIDTVIARDVAGNRTFTDQFRFQSKTIRSSYFSFFCFLLLILTALYLLMKEFGIPEKKSLLSIITMTFGGMLVFLVAELYLLFFYVSSYPNVDSLPFKIWDHFISHQNTSILDWKKDRLNEIHAELAQYRDTDTVLWIGSSQTWGAGARVHDDTFVKVAERLTQQHGHKNLTFINAGINGSTAKESLAYYKENWIQSRPKLVIINFSSNDTDPEIFQAALQEFVDTNKKNNIKTVFILEANSTEVRPSDLPLHALMREVGARNNILTIDLHAFIKDQTFKGILWWDYVHLTSFGQHLAGEYLFKQLDTLQQWNFR